MSEQRRAVMTQEVGALLIKELGLPPSSTRCEILFEVDKPVLVKCEFNADERVRGLIQRLATSYILFPRQQYPADAGESESGIVETTTLASQAREYALEVEQPAVIAPHRAIDRT